MTIFTNCFNHTNLNLSTYNVLLLQFFLKKQQIYKRQTLPVLFKTVVFHLVNFFPMLRLFRGNYIFKWWLINPVKVKKKIKKYIYFNRSIYDIIYNVVQREKTLLFNNLLTNCDKIYRFSARIPKKFLFNNLFKAAWFSGVIYFLTYLCQYFHIKIISSCI